MIEIKMKVDEVDYERALETLLPLLAEHFSSKTDNALISGILSKTKGLPVAAVKAMLKTFPQETKDELAVFCLNYYGENISHILPELLWGEHFPYTYRHLREAGDISESAEC